MTTRAIAAALTRWQAAHTADVELARRDDVVRLLMDTAPSTHHLMHRTAKEIRRLGPAVWQRPLGEQLRRWMTAPAHAEARKAMRQSHGEAPNPPRRHLSFDAAAAQLRRDAYWAVEDLRDDIAAAAAGIKAVLDAAPSDQMLHVLCAPYLAAWRTALDGMRPLVDAAVWAENDARRQAVAEVVQQARITAGQPL